MKKGLLAYGFAGIALTIAAIAFSGCSSTFPRRNPTGEVFPTVRGKSLEGDLITLPDVGRGKPLLLLIGYEQNTQFDLDRWLLGLDQSGVKVRAFEVPTIPGLIPGLISGTIDGGMRRGIPSEDWQAVVTVYDDAELVTRFTGNENPLPGRIVLLDGTGKVVFFHDRGYSTGSLRRMQAILNGL